MRKKYARKILIMKPLFSFDSIQPYTASYQRYIKIIQSCDAHDFDGNILPVYF